jgi:ABC-type Fe3+-siderophore transport system permease subunit
MIGSDFGSHIGLLVAGTVLRWLAIAAVIGALIGAVIMGQVARKRSAHLSPQTAAELGPGMPPNPLRSL